MKLLINFSPKRIISFLIAFLLLFLCSCESKHNQSGNKSLLNSFDSLQSTENINYSKLEEILTQFEQLTYINSFSIVRGNDIITEKYYNGCTTNSNNNIFSVTKSVISLLIGIAIEDGYIKSVDQKIGDFIDLEKLNVSDQHKTLTIRHLLTMSSGFVFAPNENEHQNIIDSKEPIIYMLEREIDVEPGTTFRYCNSNAHLLSIIISTATGMSTEEYAKLNLFDPLSIKDFEWGTDYLANYIGGSELNLKCQDMIKIGMMVKNKGKFNGKQIVPESWLKESTTSKIDTPYGTYGYLWWLNKHNDLEYYVAAGYGGQNIFVIEDLDMVITSSSDAYVYPDTASQQADQIASIIFNQIIPLFGDE